MRSKSLVIFVLSALVCAACDESPDKSRDLGPLPDDSSVAFDASAGDGGGGAADGAGVDGGAVDTTIALDAMPSDVPSVDAGDPADSGARTDATSLGPNLVLNPGFEDGKTHWDKGTRMTVVSHDVHSGSYCLMTPQQEVDGEVDEVRQTVGGIVPGRSYLLSAWVKGDDLGGTKGVRIRYYWGRSGVELAPSELLFSRNGTFGYTQPSGTITAPAQANELEIIYIHYNTGTGTAYGDDFSLREVGAP